MNQPDKRIIEVIKKHHVLTIATSKDNQPWCASCFYTWLSNENLFAFTTDPDTTHGQQITDNYRVAANIYLETKIVGKIQGIQITGTASIAKDELKKIAHKQYLKQYPYAALIKTTMWVLKPTILKLTDNRLGFGKKLIWDKNKNKIQEND